MAAASHGRGRRRGLCGVRHRRKGFGRRGAVAEDLLVLAEPREATAKRGTDGSGGDWRPEAAMATVARVHRGEGSLRVEWGSGVVTRLVRGAAKPTAVVAGRGSGSGGDDKRLEAD
uniref:DUF834 domain-containing protein n=1 Tax=Oryza sativa subsp. japonica TaxID=39947 RepID=Q5Z533_ORYSJ|nr:hypothetical protein [Oryza sativa Japonica Group]BAD62161.1 hypothetical protein [Oryza sativa Japonica Group]